MSNRVKRRRADAVDTRASAEVLREGDWDKVVAATEGHNIDTITVHMEEDNVKSWTYIRCTCGTQDEAYTEPWEFTDHIRRLVFAALRSDSDSGTHGHDVPGVGYLWWDASGKIIGGPEDD